MAHRKRFQVPLKNKTGKVAIWVAVFLIFDIWTAAAIGIGIWIGRQHQQAQEDPSELTDEYHQEKVDGMRTGTDRTD